MEQEPKHVIEVQNLTKEYAKSLTKAVEDVSFYVEEGSFFSLLGPNGAGKTTIISILTTILSKTSGKVTVSGFDIEKESAKVRLNIGVIFQNPSLDVNLTAEENIRFHANLYGLYPYRPTFSFMDKGYQHKVKELASVIGLTEDIFKPVRTLSGGMKRKLEIIRSLMHRPKVLFLDEPTTGLDPISRSNLWQYLKDIRGKEKTTIFLTTHYLEEAEESDYICIIDHGKIKAKGSPQEIKKDLIENYLIVDTPNRKGLLEELTARKIGFTGEGPIRINLETNNVHEIIKSIATPLTRIEVYVPSLEEAYVKIIREKEEENNE